MEQLSYEFEALTTSEKIINKIKLGDSEYIFNGLCKYKNNELYLDYIFFKHFASNLTYSIVLSVIKNTINIILNDHDTFIVHANLKALSLTELDKHKGFITSFSLYLKEQYPNKLDKCYLYNSPMIFSQLFIVISNFMDKDTLSKIKLV